MEEKLRIAYTKCGFCTAKNHCQACGEELSEALSARPGILEAQIDTKAHTAHIVHQMDLEDLLDLLEGMGLMEE